MSLSEEKHFCRGAGRLFNVSVPAAFVRFLLADEKL